MSEDTKIVIIPPDYSPAKIETSIFNLNQPLAELLIQIGLPTEDVLTPIDERRKVIHGLESTLEILPYDEKQKAVYLSKFTISIVVGLFDGALAFLWDETIKALRRLVISFDLEYFFSVAETLSSRYKNLNVEDDLEAISEHDLIEICRRIGLVTDINFKRLEHVNYLRNHASSAHPNENDISGIEMLSILEHCLKYAIIARPDHSIIQLKLLLDNIKKNSIPDEDFEHIGKDFARQPQERINDFLFTIFGLYCDPRQEQDIKNNIEKLIPYIWACNTEDTKFIIGSKYGLYRKNGDLPRKNATQKFLEIVNGLKYKDEDSLAAELIEKLQNLRSVHFSFYNFYNEYSHAKSIKDSIPPTGIPESARKLFVKIICICYIGNGKGYREGVDESALIYYDEFIKKFTVKEVIEFLYLLQDDDEFVYDFDMNKADRRVRKLSEYFKTKTSDVHINKVLDLLISFPDRTINKISSDKRYKDTIKFVKRP